MDEAIFITFEGHDLSIGLDVNFIPASTEHCWLCGRDEALMFTVSISWIHEGPLDVSKELKEAVLRYLSNGLRVEHPICLDCHWRLVDMIEAS